MKTLKTVDEYNTALEKLIKLMNSPISNSKSKEELTHLLDVVDSYNGMDFLKVSIQK
jgi:hypothetical protein